MPFRLHILAAAAVVLISCSGGDTLFVTDEAWAALNGEEKEIRQAFRTEGYRIDVSVVGRDNLEERMIDTLETSEHEVVILSPLLSGYSGRLSAGFPERQFVAYGPPGMGDVFAIHSDRVDIMKETGRACAEWASAQECADKTAAAVFLTGSEDRDAEYSAFMVGWNSFAGDCSLETLRLSLNDNSDELDTFLSLDLLERSVLGIFFAGRFNQRAVEFCSSVSVPVVTEQVPSGGGYNADFLYILRESYLDAAVQALSLLKSGGGGEGGLSMQTLLIEGRQGENQRIY